MWKAASLVSFFGALLIGVSAATLANWFIDKGTAYEQQAGPGTVEVSYKLQRPVFMADDAAVVPLRAEDVVGVWSGTWGHSYDACTIEIDRVEGTKFYGTLREGGAVISLEGWIDADARRIHFKETRVVKLGPYMSEWSLGINSGRFSADGRTVTGFGTDKWGTYQWSASMDSGSKYK